MFRRIATPWLCTSLIFSFFMIVDVIINLIGEHPDATLIDGGVSGALK